MNARSWQVPRLLAYVIQVWLFVCPHALLCKVITTVRTLRSQSVKVQDAKDGCKESKFLTRNTGQLTESCWKMNKWVLDHCSVRSTYLQLIAASLVILSLLHLSQMVPVLNIISPLPTLYWHAVTAQYTSNVHIPLPLLISGCAILYGNNVCRGSLLCSDKTLAVFSRCH